MTAGNYDWSNKTILIGEDEYVNFRLLEIMLSKTNAKVLHGKNGLEALEIFKNADKIDIVLMDIKMPLMDGCDAAREIRKINPFVPIIAQTAFALESETQKSIEAGCNCFITKPISKTELLALLDSFLKV
jgi:FOG: CheY-like receiver